jgi:uncharacterized membrane protein YedE/YeeE
MNFESFDAAHWAILWWAFGIAVVMGAVANKTNFCTMGAVSDLVNMGDTGRIRAWILAMAVAVLGVTILEFVDVFSTDGARPPYRGSSFAWLEYIIGGTLFGIGMTLGSGCGNKTLVRIGGGNLKSILVFIVISIFAYFMINPFPGTDDTIYSLVFYPWTNPTTVSLVGSQDIGALISAENKGTMRLVAGLVVAALLLFFVFKSAEFRSSFDNKLGGLVIGLCVVGAWYVSAGMATITADGETYSWTNYASNDVWMMMPEAEQGAAPSGVAPQSYTFINPIGEMTSYAVGNNVDGMRGTTLTFGMMAVFGVIIGSLLWALLSKSFRIEWFVNGKDFVTHLIGAILMGVGGVLALGCTIGQAVTGVSTLAVGSFLAFISIVFGSALTMKIQYYKLVYEEEATFMKAFITALVDMKLLPGGMRKLDAV